MYIPPNMLDQFSLISILCSIITISS